MARAASPGAAARTQSVVPPDSAEPDTARPEIGRRAAQVTRGGRHRGGLKLLRSGGGNGKMERLTKRSGKGKLNQ